MRSYVIILNTNGWKHTIECLESVCRIDCPDARIVLCDNASSDGSLDRVKAWARGELIAEVTNPQLSFLSSPPVPKPISYREFTREQAEGGVADCEARLILIQNGANLGFGGGTNIGLRYALSDPGGQFFWMLNNDTVVESNALSAMVHLMQQRPEIGLCGSLNLSYYSPKEVQAQGGKTYISWTARVHSPPAYTVDELDLHTESIDYVSGASMLASRTFLEKIGLIEESYFLYFDELDWAMRAKGKFKLGYAPDSVIYHKEGATVGTSRERMKRSLFSERYATRSRILFTKRFLPWALPTVLIWVCIAAAHRLFLGDAERAKLMLKAMLQGLTAPARGTSSR
jgi:GT2 family glycosyltransferase